MVWTPGAGRRAAGRGAAAPASAKGALAEAEVALDAASDAAAAIASAPPRARRGAGVGGPSPFEAAGARIPRGLAAQAPPGVHATPEAAGAGAGAPASAATSTGGGRGSTSSDSSAAAAPAGGGGDKCAAGAGGMQRDGSLASVPSDEPPPAAPRVVRFAPAPAALPIGGGSCLPPLTPQDTLAAGKLDEQLAAVGQVTDEYCADLRRRWSSGRSSTAAEGAAAAAVSSVAAEGEAEGGAEAGGDAAPVAAAGRRSSSADDVFFDADCWGAPDGGDGCGEAACGAAGTAHGVGKGSRSGSACCDPAGEGAEGREFGGGGCDDLAAVRDRGPLAAERAAPSAAAVAAAAAEGALSRGSRRCSFARAGAAPAEREAPEAAGEGLVLVCGAAMIPHVDKAHTGGEDAYFVSSAGHGAFAVSDGVSAWALDGIDPGDYSRTLVENLREALEEAAPAHWRRGAPFEGRSILRHAQLATLKPGSATVVLAALWPRAARGGGGRCERQPSSSPPPSPPARGAAPPAGRSGSMGAGGRRARPAHSGSPAPGGGGGGGGAAPGGPYDLHISNLGDCGVKVIRGGRIVMATQPQQHDFNLPFQLSHPRLFPETDVAASADRYVVEVQEGDVIVAASDGLFDNMWDDQLLAILSEALGTRPAPNAAARRWAALRQHAHRHGHGHGHGRGAGRGAAGARGGQERGAGQGGSGSGGGSPTHGHGHGHGQGVFGSWGGWGRLHRAWFGAGAAAGAASGVACECECEGNGAGDGEGEGASSLRRASSAPAPAPPPRPAGAAPPPPPPPPAAPPCPSELARRAAAALARAAHANALDDAFRSPWAVAAGRQSLLARLFSRGGKMDDCTCVVALVTDAARAPASARRA